MSHRNLAQPIALSRYFTASYISDLVIILIRFGHQTIETSFLDSPIHSDRRA